MKTKHLITSVLALILTSPSFGAVYHFNTNVNTPVSTSTAGAGASSIAEGGKGGNSTSTSGSVSSATGGQSTSGSSALSGGNTLSQGQGNSQNVISPTIYPQQPGGCYNVGNSNTIVCPGNGISPYVLTVPKVINYGPGVEDRDGKIYIDGQQAECDNAHRGGLPACWHGGGNNFEQGNN